MKLDEKQLNFFNTFGYLHFPALFDAAETAWITEEFDLSIQEFGDGKEHDGSSRTMFGGPIEHRPRLCALLDDARVTGVIGGVLGEDFNYASGDGNYYTGDTHWHPDGNWGQLFACKVAFYLDPLTAGSGCLRVIPGSQRPDHFVRTQGINPNQAQELFGVEPHDFPGSIALETRPGDLVIFNHDLFHASFGGNERRRMFTMNNTRHCTRAEDLETLHSYLSLHSPGCHDHDTGAGMFYPTMVDSAGPQRRVHLQQCGQVHDELFPQFARSG